MRSNVAAVLALVAWPLATAVCGGPVHVATDTQAGAFYWADQITGTVSGILSPDLGRGPLVGSGGGALGVEGSMRWGPFRIDGSVLSLSHNTSTPSPFSFSGVLFPGGASVSDKILSPELMFRLTFTERPSLGMYFMAGAREGYVTLSVNDGVNARTLDKSYLFPEVGGSLWVGLSPHLRVFGSVKWFDLTRHGDASYSLDTDAGFTLEVDSQALDGTGVLLTAGYRLLELEAKTQIGLISQSNFDTHFEGAYVSATKLF